jgi:hypothetical protein
MTADATAGRSVFDELMAEATAGAAGFGHREHLHLTWLAVRRLGVAAATDLVSDGIRETARYAGAPQKYHVTMSRAWVEMVAFHVAEADAPTFDEFAAHHRALLDKRLLSRFYSSAVLAGPAARTRWVEPDRSPMPALA